MILMAALRAFPPPFPGAAFRLRVKTPTLTLLIFAAPPPGT